VRKTKPYYVHLPAQCHGLTSLAAKWDSDRARKASQINVDLTSLESIDIVALVVFIARLRIFLESVDAQSVRVELPTSPKVLSFLSRLGALNWFENLNKLQHGPDLFETTEEKQENEASRYELLLTDPPRVKQALWLLNASSSKSRQDWIVYFRRELRGLLDSQAECDFGREQLYIIVTELVKNTIDHSGKDAYLGLELLMDESDRRILRMQFVFCELGDGISSSIRRYLGSLQGETHEHAELKRLAMKGAIADLLRLAFKPDFTTKPESGVNFGVGLNLILQGARGVGMSCMLLDSHSAVNLSSLDSKLPLSHTSVRSGSTGLVVSPPLTFVFEWEASR